MASCRNCGATVSKRYARVFAPENVESEGEVRVCPDCDDKIRGDNGQVREARSPRRE